MLCLLSRACELQNAQPEHNPVAGWKEDGSDECLDPDPSPCLQAYLLVWLYIGVHNLTGLQSANRYQRQGQRSGSAESSPPAWLAAAGLLAAQGTPWETLAGADALKAGDNVGENVHRYLPRYYGHVHLASFEERSLTAAFAAACGPDFGALTLVSRRPCPC